MWLAKVLFTSEQPKKNKMAFVGTLSQTKLLFRPLVIQLVWYLLKHIIHLTVGESGGYLPPLWWIIVNYFFPSLAYHFMDQYYHVYPVSYFGIIMYLSLILSLSYIIHVDLFAIEKKICKINILFNSHASFATSTRKIFIEINWVASWYCMTWK